MNFGYFVTQLFKHSPGIIDVSNNVILTTAIGTVYKNDSAQIFTLVVLMMNSSGIIRYKL